MLDEIFNRIAKLNEAQQKAVLDFVKNLTDQEDADLENERSHPRTSVKFEVDVLIDDKLIKTNTQDISASGVFIGAKAKVEKGLPAKVVLTIPGQRTPFKLNGSVVRAESDGFAIWFGDMAPYARRALAEQLGV